MEKCPFIKNSLFHQKSHRKQYSLFPMQKYLKAMSRTFTNPAYCVTEDCEISSLFFLLYCLLDIWSSFLNSWVSQAKCETKNPKRTKVGITLEENKHTLPIYSWETASVFFPNLTFLWAFIFMKAKGQLHIWLNYRTFLSKIQI